MSSFRLDGQVAVVTGAGGKLGPHWVTGLTDAGATVFAIDRDELGLAAVASPSVTTYVADVTSREALSDAERACRDSVGEPSVVVASAGIDSPPGGSLAPGTVDEVSPEEFARVLEVNLLGTFLTLQAFGVPMAARGHGSIVTIGSLYASISPEPTFYDHLDPPFLKPPAYGASKAGVYHLTRYFARLWGPRGVRVNMLSPGGIAGGQDPSFTSKFEARVPLRRLGEPAELAGALVFLASTASSYVSGLNLRVDGGFSA